ncbi:MAG: nickel-responsive transcriptional regulator NikR, partial [Thermoplasmata archaeon]
AMLQHRFEEIRTMLHTHLDENDCLEIFVADGPTARLKELIGQIRRVKGVKQIKFIHTAAGL